MLTYWSDVSGRLQWWMTLREHRGTVNRGGNINDCFFKTWLCTDGKRRKTKPEFWSCAAGPTLFLPVWGPRTHTLTHTRTLTHKHRFQRKPPFTMGLNQTAILQLHLRGGGAERESGLNSCKLCCVCVCMCVGVQVCVCVCAPVQFCLKTKYSFKF